MALERVALIPPNGKDSLATWEIFKAMAPAEAGYLAALIQWSSLPRSNFT